MTLRPLLHRALALAILGAIPSAIWLGCVDPLWQRWTERTEAEARSTRLLAAFTQTINSLPLLEAQLKKLQQDEQSNAGLVTGNSSSLAGAALQAEIKRIVESKGGQIRSTQQLTPTQDHGLEKVSTRFDFVASLDALPNMIYEIESHVPYLFIDNMDIHAPEDGRPEIYAANNPVLTVRWDVSGYRLPGST